MKTNTWRHTLLLGIFGGLVSVTANGWLPETAIAQFSSPPGQGTPQTSAGGGTRSADSLCAQSNNSGEVPFVAMAPTQTVGLTTQASPTIWVHVPQTTAKTLEFSLFTQEQEGIYQVNLPISTAGLLKITLPPTTILTTGRSYYWTATLICNPKRRTEDWTVTGWIQQRPLSATLQQQLITATGEQQVKLYAQSGFWYESLTLYLKLRQMQPGNTNLSVLWGELLKVAGLKIITEPTLITHAPH